MDALDEGLHTAPRLLRVLQSGDSPCNIGHVLLLLVLVLQSQERRRAQFIVRSLRFAVEGMGQFILVLGFNQSCSVVAVSEDQTRLLILSQRLVSELILGNVELELGNRSFAGVSLRKDLSDRSDALLALLTTERQYLALGL